MEEDVPGDGGVAGIVNYRLEMPNNIAMGHTAKVRGIPGAAAGREERAGQHPPAVVTIRTYPRRLGSPARSIPPQSFPDFLQETFPAVQRLTRGRNPPGDATGKTCAKRQNEAVKPWVTL